MTWKTPVKQEEFPGASVSIDGGSDRALAQFCSQFCPNNRVHRTNLTAAGSISCPGSFRTIIICARTAASAGPLALPSYKPNSLGTTTEQIET